MKLSATPVFEKLYEAFLSKKYNGYVMEGGSRSSKTRSIIDFIIIYCQANYEQNKRIVVSRAVGTWINATVLADFKEVLQTHGFWNDADFNKTTRIYKLFGNEIWFLGLDSNQKLHGLKMDIFWGEEAVEMKKDDFDQLEMRLNNGGFFIISYNPSHEEHWIYDSVNSRPDVFYCHSTMLDNSFLPEPARRKILSYEPTEENYKLGTADPRKWKIYGLGERAKIEGLVFERFTQIKEIPDYVTMYNGLDFGFTNDPTSIMEVGVHTASNSLYLRNRCHDTRMTSNDIITKLKGVNEGNDIWSESADPRLVEEIYNSGFNIYPVKKYAGSVKAGIDKMQSMNIFITEDSSSTIKEFKNYTYKQDKNGKWLNEPIDDFNHDIDASRYVILGAVLGQNYQTQQNVGRFFNR